MTLVLAVFAFLASACGGPSASEPASNDDPETEFIAPEERCDVDADCVVTDFPGCCACCSCSVPYAIRADALASQRAECADTDCAPIQEEAGCAVEECVGCPLEEGPFAAVCRRGRCVREP
jgi:hypothetical protein